MDEQVLDFNGNSLTVGELCVRPEKRGNMAELSTCRVVSFDLSRKYGDVVEVIGYNSYTGQMNLKTGWTYPRRLLKQN